MDMIRFLRHSLVPHWWAMRALPPGLLGAIERAIGESEKRHAGELRFVVEGPLPAAVLGGKTSRQRAIDLFSQLRVWDTEANSGVLIYVQLVDRKVEILADRGINARVDQSFWDGVCLRLQAAFREGRFEAGALAAIAEITDVLARHFPAGDTNPNELPDKPVVL